MMLACWCGLAGMQAAAQAPAVQVNKLDYTRSIAPPHATIKYLEEIQSWTTDSHTVRLLSYPSRQLICRYRYIDLQRKIKQGLYLAWHANGQLSDSGFYKQNRRHGAYYEWHANGQLKSVTHYQFDRPADTTRHWYEDGALLTEMITDNNGMGERTDYYPSGEAWGQGPVRNGQPHGTWTFWRPAGTPLMTVAFEEGQPAATECYDEKANGGQQPCAYLQPANFEGGSKAWQAWVAEHLRYPRFGPEGKFRGMAKVQFQINDKGEMTNIDILQSPGEAFDEEVRRLLAACPRWQPARMAGRPIGMQLVQDILFDNRLLIRR